MQRLIMIIIWILQINRRKTMKKNSFLLFHIWKHFKFKKKSVDISFPEDVDPVLFLFVSNTRESEGLWRNTDPPPTNGNSEILNDEKEYDILIFYIIDDWDSKKINLMNSIYMIRANNGRRRKIEKWKCHSIIRFYHKTVLIFIFNSLLCNLFAI